MPELNPKPVVKNGPRVTDYSKTTWNDTNKPNCEKRETSVGGFYPRFGRSTVQVTCPFCGTDHEVYLWSFSGCGRRCNICGAIMGHMFAYRLMKEGEIKPAKNPNPRTGIPRAKLTGLSYDSI